MRMMLALRGFPGCGKSTWTRENNLTPFALSFDTLKSLHGGLELSVHGGFLPSTLHSEQVFSQFCKLLDQRLAAGSLTLIDNTNLDVSDIDFLSQRAAEYGYEFVVVDFTLQVSFDEARRRNERRPHYQVVPDASMQEFLRLSRTPIPNGIKQMSPGQAAWHLVYEDRDFSDIPVIHHIGDIQGCATPLRNYLDRHFRDDSLFIFTGDLLDRGIENGEVFQLIEAIPAKNRILITGNHELHLERQARNKPAVSKEFREATLPQLRAAGITNERIKALADQFVDGLVYRYGDRRVVATHGGLPCIPSNLNLVASHQLWKGVGGYRLDIDGVFEANTQANEYQVHGHRNLVGRDLRADQRSFNLEGDIEYGGHLRVARLNSSGFEVELVRNSVYRRPKHDPAFERVVSSGWGSDQATPALLQELERHPLIRENRIGEISSFNFTRQAFYDRAFDAVNSKARGFFVHRPSARVVARGYDKFFNMNEYGIAGADEASVMARMQYPVTGYVKENGSLGLVGFNPQDEELFYASKASSQTDFALRLRERMEMEFTQTVLDKLRRWLRDNNASLALEVIEPELDPHIIHYEAPKLVLLDVIHRGDDFRRLSYDRLQVFARYFGFEVKAKAFQLPNAEALAGALRAAKSGWKWHGKEVEGLVLEDAVGYQVKIKLPFYNHWKSMRAVRDAVLKSKIDRLPLKPRSHWTDDQRSFAAWLEKQQVDIARLSIPKLRDVWQAQNARAASADRSGLDYTG